MTNRLFKAACDECPKKQMMIGDGEGSIKHQLIYQGWDVAEDRNRLTCPRCRERLSKEQSESRVG